MKKVLLPLFSFLLVLGLLGASFSSAKAEIGDDPVVTPVSGDMEFATEVVPVASLPSTTVLENQMLVPVGFPLGEAQFEGVGVRVTGMDYGKATACFAVSGMQYGWGGKVGVWNGTKWVLLPTTITKAEEALNSLACASVAGNGTYAFIKYVVDPSLLPTCAYDTSAWYLGYVGYYYAGNVGSSLPFGTPVTYKIFNLNPAGAITGDLTGSGTVGNFLPNDADFLGTSVSINGGTATVRISAGGCYKDFFMSYIDT